MDSLTHVVFGAALGEVILGKKIGKKAMLLGAIANTIPDLDVFLVLGDPIREITLHRGISHSLLFPFFMAPLLGWLANRYFKDNVSFKVWAAFFFTLIITHPLLDCLTTYGTQLLLPFSDYRVNLNNIFIIDFVFTIPMIVAVIACLILKTNNPLRIKWSRGGLAISAAYVLLSLCGKTYASQVFEQSLKENGISTEHRMTGVTPFNILLWYNVAEVDSGYFIGDYSLLDADKNIRYSFVKRHEELLAEMKDEYAINRLVWFSNRFYAVEKVKEEIRFYTLKFGTTGFDLTKPLSETVPFYYSITKQADGRITVKNTSGFDKLHLKDALTRLGSRVMGNRDAFVTGLKN